jgi:hypothetical protein
MNRRGLMLIAAGALGVSAIILFAGILMIRPRTPHNAIAEHSARPTPISAGNLTQPGNLVSMPAIDSHGQFGTIVVERGADLGGYAHALLDGAPLDGSDAFFTEIFVSYQLDRLPDPEQFGLSDWILRAAEGTKIESAIEPARLFGGPEPSLGVFPGAIDVLATPSPTRGWIVFQVDRQDSHADLELVYWPKSQGAPVATVVVRESGAPPMPVAAATPTPQPTRASGTEDAFAVIANDEADALFAEVDTCHQPGGYTVEFPESWYTNTAIADVPACSWFSPTFFEVQDPAQVPKEIVIALGTFEGGVGSVFPPISSESVVIGGRKGYRIEDGYTGATGQLPTDPFVYRYGAWLDDDYLGLKFMASTSSERGADYLLNEALLDRMVASIKFGD